MKGMLVGLAVLVFLVVGCGPTPVDEIETSGTYEIVQSDHPRGERSVSLTVVIPENSTLEDVQTVSADIVKDFYADYELITAGVSIGSEDQLAGRLVSSNSSRASELVDVPNGEYVFEAVNGDILFRGTADKAISN